MNKEVQSFSCAPEVRVRFSAASCKAHTFLFSLAIARAWEWASLSATSSAALCVPLFLICLHLWSPRGGLFGICWLLGICWQFREGGYLERALFESKQEGKRMRKDTEWRRNLRTKETKLGTKQWQQQCSSSNQSGKQLSKAKKKPKNVNAVYRIWKITNPTTEQQKQQIYFFCSIYFLRWKKKI